MTLPPTMLAQLGQERQRELERRADAWARGRADAFGAAPGDRRTTRLLTRLLSWQHSLHHHRWTIQHQPQEES
jgi:hypothetical protein